MLGHRPRWVIALVVVLAGCAPATPNASETTASVGPSAASVVSASPSGAADGFPIEAFADISEGPVSADTAAELQAVLDDAAGGVGISAVVMSADGTWSGATGSADGVRDVTVDDQFSIASTTKAIVAAQVMQMVEAGEIGLDDPVAEHLPPHVDFDTNGATIRELLGMHSGIPEHGLDAGHRLELEEITPALLRLDARRAWTPGELLDEVSAERTPAGERFEYVGTNYLFARADDPARSGTTGRRRAA
jgi:D-alanyl-D-alanine carboxypeptidase